MALAHVSSPTTWASYSKRFCLRNRLYLLFIKGLWVVVQRGLLLLPNFVMG